MSGRYYSAGNWFWRPFGWWGVGLLSHAEIRPDLSERYSGQGMPRVYRIHIGSYCLRLLRPDRTRV